MASQSVVVVVGIVVALAGIGVGFLAGYEYRGTPSSSPSDITNNTLYVLGAGTLVNIFPRLASALVNETPSIMAPVAAQTYEGSLDITTAIASLSAKADVAAVADFRLIPSLLQPKYASYEVVFGTTQEVLCYNPTLAAFDGINSTNWAWKLVQDVHTPGNAPFAIWNASTDPNGYNEIFSLQLQGMLYNDSTTQFYSTFYTRGSTAPAVGNPSTTLPEHESQATTLLTTGVVSALITYKAFAVTGCPAYVPFTPIVGLEANNSTALTDYAKLSTTVVGSTGSFATVVPAPILFSASVPTNAPNPALGAAFLHLLLSPQGAAILSANGAFVPIFPGWSNAPRAVPPVLAPDVEPLPSWASPFLT
jgi:molybdate/tungstate transport system substrate-binding protein